MQVDVVAEWVARIRSGAVVVGHQQLLEVRSQIASLQGLIEEFLAASDDAKRTAQLEANLTALSEEVGRVNALALAAETEVCRRGRAATLVEIGRCRAALEAANFARDIELVHDASAVLGRDLGAMSPVEVALFLKTDATISRLRTTIEQAAAQAAQALAGTALARQKLADLTGKDKELIDEIAGWRERLATNHQVEPLVVSGWMKLSGPVLAKVMDEFLRPLAEDARREHDWQLSRDPLLEASHELAGR